MSLITKSDFSEFVQFTNNIQDRLINASILKAETLDFEPLVSATFWTDINSTSPPMGSELQAFFDNFCKPILVHFAMNRYLIEAGKNITQFGLVVPVEPTSEPVSDRGRADMRNQYKSDLQSYLAKFYKELCRVSYTFDGTVYDFDCRVKQTGIRIQAV